MATGADWRRFINDVSADRSLALIVSVQFQHCAGVEWWKTPSPMCNRAHIHQPRWWTAQYRMYLLLTSPSPDCFFTFYLCICISQTSRCCSPSFFPPMLPNWSRPESFWQSKWQDDRLGRQSKGSEGSFWTASCYLLFLCRIIILRLFTPWTLIGIANADVQWLSIRIKDANNVKWGHVSKAAPFPRLFIAAPSKENLIITEAVLYLASNRTAFILQSLDFFFFPSSIHGTHTGPKDVLLDWKHLTIQKEDS